MKPSSAGFIAYDLRPSKQAERRILLDFLKCANEAGITISDCRYVGMGGTKFYDFHLMYRFLGLKNTVSLERDPGIHKRAEFNCPYKFVKVEQKTVAEFLAYDLIKTPTIYWLDYDDGVSQEITADIISLGTKITVGGFAFVTVYANPPGVLNGQNTGERLEYFHKNFGDFSIGLTIEDMENVNFPTTVYRILMAAFKNAFAARSDGKFHVFFRIQYQDTSPMITVGGCFCTEEHRRVIEKRIKTDLPFLLTGCPYKIRNLTLTERERSLFDVAVTDRRANSRHAKSLRALGFRPKDFETYRDLIRFLPRYHESII